MISAALLSVRQFHFKEVTKGEMSSFGASYAFCAIVASGAICQAFEQNEDCLRVVRRAVRLVVDIRYLRDADFYRSVLTYKRLLVTTDYRA